VHPLTSAALTLALACACGTDPSLPHGAVTDPTPIGYDASTPLGACGAIEQEFGIEGYQHLEPCTVVHYGTKPPSSGDHYAVWSNYKTYADAIPEGYWVHNLEHGAIVITYNCPSGCAADVAAAQQMIDALPIDPVCTALGEGVRSRVIMTPDPKLDVEFAASAWGWTLRARCFDPEVFRAFAVAHYGQGREPYCDNDVDVTATVPACGG
jgi:hypothetical protein